MVMVAIAPNEVPSTTESSAVVIGRPDGGTVSSPALTVAGSLSWLSTDDPLIERPIEFVLGVRARPKREPQAEPDGTGPFGF